MNLKNTGAAGIALVAAGLALSLGATSGFAQVLTDPSAVAATPAAQAAAGAPAATASEPPAPAVAAAPVPQTDPVLDEVRAQLPRSARAGVDRNDVAALTAFYAERNEPLWVGAQGFTPRARDAMAEIRKADEWGLSASAFELPQLAAGESRPAALAEAEIKLGLAALKYARHARGGRLDPSQLSRYIDQKPTLVDPKEVIAAVAATDAPGSYLRGLHPKHPEFVRLRQALLKMQSGGVRPEPEPEPLVQIPSGPLLKPGMEHPHVALLRERLDVAAGGNDQEFYDDKLAEAVKAFQREKRLPADGLVGARVRAVLNGAAKPATASPSSDAQRIIINMERWRWMPEELGELFVWDNIPEFTTRVVKDGHTIHQAKIIVGKVDTQTVLFSANMRYVVFGPEWGVPDSIKVKEILPYLRPNGYGGFFGGFGGTDTRILERHNLRVSFNGRPVDASQVDWSQVDIRRFTFIQPPGASNVLGAVKFRFPNRHDIYMHDTPQRELFNKDVRAFSHGCMRVQNPGRLAEILLAEDKGWSAERVRDLMARGGNNEITLSKQIPVHVTYFTAMAGEDGHVKFHADLYGHDRRLLAALAGRPLPLEAAPPSTSEGPPAREAVRKGGYKQSNNLFEGLFGN